jgi:hypothetical protein
MANTTAPTKRRLTLVDSVGLAEATFPREWLVRDVLLAGQPCVVGGPIKCLKTSLVIDLAVSLGTGTPFLGRFPVTKPRRVALFSGESGEATIQETASRVCRARGKTLGAGCRVHWGFRLPRLGSDSDCRELGALVTEHSIEVVIIDPLYLCLIAGGETVSASNLFEVGAVLLRVAETCSKAGATLVVVHHSTKGAAARKAVTPSPLYDLAYAGIGEFARQWMMLNRTTTYVDGSGFHDLVLSIGGSAGHSSRWRVRIDEGRPGGGAGGRVWKTRVQPDLRPFGVDEDYPLASGTFSDEA